MTRPAGKIAKGGDRIDERIKKQLTKILLKIIKADANEVLMWSKGAMLSEDNRMGKDIALSVSSIKIKQSGGTLDLDIKLIDKLKAIELLLKLYGDDAYSGEGGGDICISYDYRSAKNTDERELS